MLALIFTALLVVPDKTTGKVSTRVTGWQYIRWMSIRECINYVVQIFTERCQIKLRWSQLAVVDIRPSPYLLSHMLTMLRLTVTPQWLQCWKNFALQFYSEVVGLKFSAAKTKVLHVRYESDPESILILGGTTIDVCGIYNYLGLPTLSSKLVIRQRFAAAWSAIGKPCPFFYLTAPDALKI